MEGGETSLCPFSDLSYSKKLQLYMSVFMAWSIRTIATIARDSFLLWMYTTFWKCLDYSGLSSLLDWLLLCQWTKEVNGLARARWHKWQTSLLCCALVAELPSEIGETIYPSLQAVFASQLLYSRINLSKHYFNWYISAQQLLGQ